MATDAGADRRPKPPRPTSFVVVSICHPSTIGCTASERRAPRHNTRHPTPQHRSRTCSRLSAAMRLMSHCFSASRLAFPVSDRLRGANSYEASTLLVAAPVRALSREPRRGCLRPAAAELGRERLFFGTGLRRAAAAQHFVWYICHPHDASVIMRCGLAAGRGPARTDI